MRGLSVVFYADRAAVIIGMAYPSAFRFWHQP